MRAPLGAALLASLVLAGGCSAVTGFKGISMDADGTYVSGLPPIRQDGNYSCGPACTAAVAAYWNVHVADFRAAHPRVPGDTNADALVALAADVGLQGFAYRGSMADLKDNLLKGRPLIVMIPQPLIPEGEMASVILLGAWNRWGPKPSHWVVVTGTLGDREVVVHDPESGPMTIKTKAFAAWWTQKENLTVLIVPK